MKESTSDRPPNEYLRCTNTKEIWKVIAEGNLEDEALTTASGGNLVRAEVKL